MKYKIIKISKSKKELQEQTFCFACGCFQGNTGPSTGTKTAN